MRKGLLPKIAGVAALYAAIFLALSVLQFAKQGSFSRQLGDLRINGNFAKQNTAHDTPGESYVEDGVGVFFGGLEFYLSSAELYGLTYLDANGNRVPVAPESMVLSSEAVRFKLKDSLELSFYVQHENGLEELVISSFFPDNIMGIEVPYRPLKRTQTKTNEKSADGSATILVEFNNHEYMFDRAILDTSRRIITLSNKNPIVAYRVVPEKSQFNPALFIISGAMEKSRYDDLVELWCDKAFAGMERQIFGGINNEEVIAAYVAEAARRGSYQSAVDSIPASFRNGQNRTFLSAPFLGRLDIALRTITTSEKNIITNYSASLKNDPMQLLRDERVFEYLALRGRTALFDEAINYIKTIDPDTLTIESCAGLFEGWWAWWQWKPDTENPFENSINRCREIIADYIIRDSENRNVFITQNNRADVLYNIRLGIALAAYGEAAQKNEWAAMGRSLALSCLNFANDRGALAANLEFTGDSNFIPVGNALINAETVYVMLRFCDYYPHAVGAGTVYNGAWIWTISPATAATFENNVLDIAVSFPTDQIHYVLIPGISPFSKIQLRGIDYRSDPQFERYNSPGWAYSASERTLLVKIVHRTPLEHIKIFF